MDDKNEPKMITLNTQRELKICMDPLRQELLRTMAVLGVPVTAKKLADTMKITPSAAKHHLLRLASIGLVEVDHTELIHGITATFYRRVNAEVNVGLGRQEYAAERSLMAENSLAGVYRGFCAAAEEGRFEPENQPFRGEMLTGVVHLTQAQADELYRLTRRFLRQNQQPAPGSEPFEYALILYNTGDTEAGR